MGHEILEETTILNSIKDKFVFKPEEPYYDHHKYREAKSEVTKSLHKLVPVIVESRLEEKIKKVNFTEDKEEANNKEWDNVSLINQHVLMSSIFVINLFAMNCV